MANGNAARMVFYHYDFVEGTAQLNVRGRDKLVKVAQLLPATFLPVVIERTPRHQVLTSSAAPCCWPSSRGRDFPSRLSES